MTEGYLRYVSQSPFLRRYHCPFEVPLLYMNHIRFLSFCCAIEGCWKRYWYPCSRRCVWMYYGRNDRRNERYYAHRELQNHLWLKCCHNFVAIFWTIYWKNLECIHIRRKVEKYRAEIGKRGSQKWLFLLNALESCYQLLLRSTWWWDKWMQVIVALRLNELFPHICLLHFMSDLRLQCFLTTLAVSRIEPKRF